MQILIRNFAAFWVSSKGKETEENFSRLPRFAAFPSEFLRLVYVLCLQACDFIRNGVFVRPAVPSLHGTFLRKLDAADEQEEKQKNFHLREL